MRLGAIIPLCDARTFLGEEPGRLPAGESFLHFFGSSAPRSARAPKRDGPPARTYGARSALRPKASPLAVACDIDPFHWVRRQITVEDPVVVRLDLGLLAHDLRVIALERKIKRIVDGWVRLPVGIPATGERGRIELQHTGVLLGAVYAHATTARRRHHEVRPAWITAGHPCFLVEWSVAEQLDSKRLETESLPELVPFREGLLVGWGVVPSAGPRARILYIARQGGPAAREAARALRNDIAAFHAQRECLWIILRQIASGRLAPPGKPRLESTGDPVLGRGNSRLASPQSDALQAYLNRAISEVKRLAACVPPFPSALRSPAREEVSELRREGALFSDALDRELTSQNVRGNIRRKAVTWVRSETGEPAPEAEEPGREFLVAESDLFARECDLYKAGDRLPDECGEAIAVEVAPPHASHIEAVSPPDAADVLVRASLGSCGRESVDAGETVSFLLSLSSDGEPLDPGPAGARGKATVHFPAGVTERRLAAVATSPHFVCPRDEKWDHCLMVRRDGVQNGLWQFRAQAYGDRPGYSLSVCFFADAQPVGTLTIELPRRSAGTIAPSTRMIPLPAPGPSRLTVRITNEARMTQLAWFSPVEGEWQKPFPLGFNVDDCLSDLGAPDHQRLDQMRSYCVPFRLSLPPDFLQAIESDASPERGLMVMSAATLMPFELLPIDRGRTVLGMARPVARWPLLGEKNRSLAITELDVRKVGCIRPEYKKDPLPSAADEESDLGRRFTSMAVARTRPELDALLAQTDIDLLHFAGHAQHNPALLKLGDSGDSIKPEAFYGRGLTGRIPSPFFFVNGCEAGLGRSGILPARGNMMETLLACDFVGAVAPLIVVDSPAARDAANAFYAAAEVGKSVAEAVQAIHRLAEQQPEKAGTFLSYVAYAPPDLHLRFRPAS
jgi:hypothetical protein